MGFVRRVITGALDLANLAKHNANFADIETDLTAHDGRITGAQNDITTHKSSTSAHTAQTITYSGAVVTADNAKEAIDTVKMQLDQAIISGDSGPEAAAARASVSGTVYPTLGDRLDTEYDGVTAQLAESTNPAHNQGGLVFGQENLSFFHKIIMAYLYFYSTQLKIRLSGDSTTQGDGTTSSAFHLDQLLQQMAYRNGLPQIKGENGGHSGMNTEHWNQTYVYEDIDSACHLLVLRWGINDPYYAHADNSMLPESNVVNPALDELRRTAADFEASLRSGLAKIRAIKSSSELSIVLMTPNSVNDSPNGRDQKWIESIIPAIKKAARDFECCFINTYQFLQDSVNAGNYMDDPYGDGRHIHPEDVMNLWISTIMFETAFPKGVLEKCKMNAVINDYSENIQKPAAAPPSTYPYGISMYRTDGTFPYDGMVITFKGIDGVLFQINMGYVLTTNDSVKRIGYTTSDSWSSFTPKNLPLLRPTLQNSWVDYDTATNNIAQHHVVDGMLHFEGGVKNGTIANNTVICVLPAGRRPSTYRFYGCQSDTGTTTISVSPDGEVAIFKNGSAGYIFLDQISFRVAQ